MQEDIGGAIVYTIKELLAEIRTKLDNLDGKLSSKADRADIADLNHRHEVMDARIDQLEREIEHQQRTQKASVEWRRYMLPTALTLALVALAVLQLLAHK